MNIQGLNSSNFKVQTAQKRQPVAFKATLPEIKDAIDKCEEKAFCPGKRNFTALVVEFFEKAQKQMGETASFKFKLKEENALPKDLATVKVEGAALTQLPLTKGIDTLKALQDKLLEGQFKCKPTSTCGCGAKQSLGEFLSDTILGKFLKVKNPDVIELNK